MASEFLNPVLLPRDPTLALEAATKQYVDAHGGSGSVVDGNGLLFSGSTLNVMPGTGISVGSNTVGLDLTYMSNNYAGLNTHELSLLADVDVSTVADGEVLVYDAATSTWVNAAGGTGGGATDLDGLTDVVINTPTATQVLTYDSATSKWRNATGPGSVGSGGTGVSGATYVIAANNANASQISAAYRSCDGAADQVQIQEVIDTIPSGSTNFTIQLTQGTFNISAPIRLRSGTSIQGMGRDATILKVASGFTDSSGEPAVIKLIDIHAHATELGNFRIDGNGIGTKINGIRFDNGTGNSPTKGNFTTAPVTDPDACHYIHDLYILDVTGNGINISGDHAPTITQSDSSFTVSDARMTVIYNTVVRNPGEHCYWLHMPDSTFIGLTGSSAGNNYGTWSAANARPNLVIMGGNSRITSSKVYSGNSHGFWIGGRCDRLLASNCEAQDCGDYGWWIDGAHGTYNNISADTGGRITGNHTSGATPLNGNVAGFYITGYNNMIQGHVLLRDRKWGNPLSHYPFYALHFDTSSSNYNVVEMHCELKMTGTSLSTALCVPNGTPEGVRGEYVRITTDQDSGVNAQPRFWLQNVLAPWGTTTSPPTGGGGWPHDATYATEPPTPEIKITNNYYDGTSTQRENVQIYTGTRKTSWLNEWGGLRLQPPNTGYGLHDSHIRLLRSSDTTGAGNPIEYQDAARTYPHLAWMDWSGKWHAPNIQDKLTMYGPSDTVEDAPHAYVREPYSLAKWIGGSNIVSGTAINRSVVAPDDTPFFETSTTNTPTYSASFITSTLPAGRGSGLNESWVGQRFEPQQSVITRFQFSTTQIPVGSSANIVVGGLEDVTSTNSPKALLKQFVLRLNTAGKFEILDDGDVAQGSPTTLTLLAGTQYIVHLKYRAIPGAGGQVSLTVCNSSNVPLAGGYKTAPVNPTVTNNKLSAFKYGIVYYNTYSSALSNKIGQLYIQKGDADDTELFTVPAMSVELASKTYVDTSIAAIPTGSVGGGSSADYRYVIATDTATATRVGADLNLQTVTGSIATALNSAFNAAGRKYFKIVGTTDIQLDNHVVINKAVDIYSNGSRIIGHPGFDSNSTARLSIFKITGSETLISAVPTAVQQAGSYTLSFSTAHGLVTGDWIRIKTDENRNINRTYYYKGELNRVLNVPTTTTVELETPLRDTYNPSGNNMGVYKMTMLQDVVIDGLIFKMSDAVSVGRQEILTVQFCLYPVIRNCTAHGGLSRRGGSGLAFSKCIGGLMDHCYAENVADWWEIGEASPGDNSRNGYGLYVGGCERTRVVNSAAYYCRHGFDVNNYGNRQWPVSRYTVFENCIATRCSQPPFTTHDADGVTFTNCIAQGNGGGFQLRGENFTLTDCKVIEPSRQWHPEWNTTALSGWGNGNKDSQGAVFVGEQQGGITGEVNSQGLAGNNLNIKGMVVEWNNPGYLGSAFFGFDPLKDAYVQMNVTASPNRGVYLRGDFVENSVFDINLHGQKQGAGYGGLEWLPQATGDPDTGPPQYMSNNTINIYADSVRGPAVKIAGGNRGGISEHNLVNINVPTLGAGMLNTSAQIQFAAGTHGKEFVGNVFSKHTLAGSAITNAGGATIIKGPLFSYTDITLQAWPVIAGKEVATKVNSPTSPLVVDCPAGYDDGDVLLAIWCSDTGAPSTTTLSDVIPPPGEGFTQVGPAQTFGNLNQRFTQFYWKTVSGAQPATFSFAFTTPTYNNYRHSVILYLLRRAGTIALESTGGGLTTTAGGQRTASAVTFAPLTTTAANTLAFEVAHVTADTLMDTDYTAIPSGWTLEDSINAVSGTSSQMTTHVLTKPIPAASTVISLGTVALNDIAIDENTIGIAFH